MCGIIYAENRGKEAIPVNKAVNRMLQDQISRGKEGFGIVFIEEDGSFKVERSTEMTKLQFDMYINASKSILLHHRNPSSSENTIQQTHPILVSNKALKFDYLIAHNGVITNSDELKEEHEKAGFIYNTTEKIFGKKEYEYNDSESLAIEIATYIEGAIKSISVRGTYAFIALKINKETQKVIEVLYGRQDNPLMMSCRRESLRIASQGKGNEVKKDMIYAMDFGTKKIHKRKLINIPPTIHSSYQPGIGFKTSYEKGLTVIEPYNDYEDCNWKDYYLGKTEKAEDETKEEVINKKLEDLGELVEGEVQKIKDEIEEKLAELEAVMLDYDSCMFLDIDSEVKDITENLKDKLEDLRNATVEIHQEMQEEYYNIKSQ